MGSGFIIVSVSLVLFASEVNSIVVIIGLIGIASIITGLLIFKAKYYFKEVFKKAEEGSVKDLNFLLESILLKKYFSRYICNLLTNLKSTQAIDLFCQKWEKERHKKLTKILLKAGYVATQPEYIRVLTALKVGKIQDCIDQNPELLKWLLVAFDDQDWDIASLAQQCAVNLTNQKAIDLFCRRWVKERHERLTKILLKAGYVASKPNNLRVLTALKVNKIKVCIDQNPKLLKWLLVAFDDQDCDIASLAQQCAVSLTNQSAIDELFYLFMEENNQIAYQCIQQAQYQSIYVNYKALFHFLRDEWNAYDEIDFDQAILQKMYQSVSTELRKSIAEKARKRGWTEWLRVAKKSREKMTPEEWDITVSILKNNREFAKMWQLVKESPIWVAQKLLIILSEYSYHPSSESNAFYQPLLLLANRSSTIKIAEINPENKSQPLFYYPKISPDWQFLITYDSNDKNPKVWQIADGKLLCSAEGYYKEISPDWQFLVTYDNRNPKVWRIANGKLLCSAEGYYKEISSDWQFLVTYDGYPDYKGSDSIVVVV